jgi:hypothetical protein
MCTRKFAFISALALASGLAAQAAHAGPNVQWQVSFETPVIRLPGHVVLPLPPIPVPRVVVTTPRHHERDSRLAGSRDDDCDGIPNRYDARPHDPRNSRGWDGQHGSHPGHARRDDRHADRHVDRHADRHADRYDWRGDRYSR